MIITGAGGHAKEMLDILSPAGRSRCCLYDDYTKDIPSSLHGIPVCRSLEEAAVLLKKDPTFVLGTGNGLLRKKFTDAFRGIGGELNTVISPLSFCSTQQTSIGIGANVMAFAFISAGVIMGEGCLINARANVHHNAVIGDYCEISPAAVLLGDVKLGNFVRIGGGAVVLPGISIGDHAVVGAGAVVTKNVEPGETVVGNPAKAIGK